MAALPESPIYAPGITQIETNEPVIGGPNGVSNRAPIELGNRTAYLKQELDNLIAEFGAIDFVPGSGGTFTGNVIVSNTSPFFQVSETDTGDFARFILSGGATRIQMPPGKNFLFQGPGGEDVGQVLIQKGGVSIALLHPENIAGEFPVALGTNGYEISPSGLIRQWGTAMSSSSADTNVTFPLTFPNGCFSLSAVCDFGTNAANLHLVAMVSNLATTGFSLRVNLNGDSAPVGQRRAATNYWTAFGH